MDDLTRIDGIGKATAKKLAEAGIDSFDKLARFGEFPELADTVEVKVDWIERAREIAHAESEQAQQQEEAAPEGGETDDGKPGAGDGGGEPANAEEAGDGNGAAGGDQAGDGGAAQDMNSEGKPLSPEVGPEAHSRDGAGLPADSRAGDRQMNSTNAPQSEEHGGAGDTAGPALPQGDDAYPALSAAAEAWRAAGNELPPKTVRITSRRDGFRRAGIAHTKEPADHPALRFGPDDLEALLSEPMLTVEFV
jgi:hypothetical protein